MTYLLGVLIVVILATVTPALAQLGSEEQICLNDSRVFFCENFESYALGNFPVTVPARFKMSGWSNGTAGIVQNTQAFSGNRGLTMVTPSGQPSGGTISNTGFFGQREFYFRWYEKFDSNYIWSPNGTKNFEIFSNSVLWNTGYGFFNSSFAPNPTVPSIDIVFLGANGPGHDGAGRFFPNTGSGFLFNRNQWYCMEFHVKFNTGITNTDGVLEAWIDNQQRWNFPAVNLENNTPNTVLASFFIPTYWNCNGPNQDDCTGTAAHPALLRYIDNIIFSTGRIGCLGSQPPPPPPPPTNFKVTIQ
jgi:hypothetical protein